MTTRRNKNRKPIASPHELEVERAVGAMSLEQVHCRDFGHSWAPHNARWLDLDNCYESTLRCGRCGTERTRFLSRTGAQLDSRYDYAEGYTIKGLGRLTGTDRDVIRLASVMALVKRKDETA